MENRLFCFGYGFSARRLARDLKREGWAILATATSEPGLDEITADGAEAYFFDGGAPISNFKQVLSGVTHILSSVPPGADGDPVIRFHGEHIASGPNLKWVGYLSTTGVYGNRDGGLVDENSARTPSGERGRRRVAAEDAWMALWRDYTCPVHLFRLAGIYGPGRNQLESVRNGTAKRIDKRGQVFSRIHVDDIAQVLQASIRRPAPGNAYNVCDDEAAPPQAVVAYAAELLGIDPPPLVPFEEAELSPMGRSFYDDNKVVANGRIKNELGVTLKWPNYREGLEGLLGT